MRLREADDVVLVEGLTESPIDSAADVLDLLDRGNERRVTALTDLNASSSRSHAVLTLVVTVWRTDSSATESRLHLVDLAGSERVKDSGVSGDRLKEAQHINRSLFALQGVVHALASGARHVPYRDDMLTRLLKPAFGGNCCTTLLATVSPAQQHAKESEGTLRFASSCRLVQSSVTVNEVKRQRPWAEPTAKVAPRPEHVAIEGGVPWTGVDASPFISHLEITTPWGLVHSLVCEGDASPKGVALLLHGSPSDATSWEWLFPALLHSGYRTVAVDMPGCGQSPGKQLPSRSEFNAKPGGPVDIACCILDHIGAQQAVVVGYDWGDRKSVV